METKELILLQVQTFWGADKMAKNVNEFKMMGSLSYMAEYFRQFDLSHPDWGELEHISHGTRLMHPDVLFDMLLKDFNARKAGGDNVAMFICGTQGTGKSLTAYFFSELLSKIWGTKFDFKNLGFFDAETSASLENAAECETIWQDEHDSKQIGALSMYLKDRLVDFVLRGRRKHINFVFCSPIEQDKGQFITLETKNTRKDPATGKPICVECLVKTPWYFDSDQRMTRGIIFVPVHELKDWESYDKRKMGSLEKLKSQYGSNFDFIGAKSKEIFESLKDFLVEKNKKNEWVVKRGNDFKAICLLGRNGIRGIGSSGTNESRDLMIATIKNYASEYCVELNKVKETDVEVITPEVLGAVE